MSKTVTLFSSSRRHGNTGQLTDLLAQSIDMEIIDLDSMNISPFDYDNKHKDDEFLPLMEKVLTYDDIVFASPVYWYAVSPGMKIFLDRISDLLTFPELLDMGRRLRGKKSYIISTSISDELSSAFLEAFVKTFDYLGMEYKGFLHLKCDEAYDEVKAQHEVTSFASLLQGHQ